MAHELLWRAHDAIYAVARTKAGIGVTNLRGQQLIDSNSALESMPEIKSLHPDHAIAAAEEIQPLGGVNPPKLMNAPCA